MSDDKKDDPISSHFKKYLLPIRRETPSLKKAIGDLTRLRDGIDGEKVKEEAARTGRMIPPWFPVEWGGKGEQRVPPLYPVQPMGQRRGISGSMIFVLFDRKFRDWTCPNCGELVPAGTLECPADHYKGDELFLAIPKLEDPS